MRTSVYVHFPWCLKKCPYCDFASGKIAREDVPHEAYADAVLAELAGRGEALDGRTLVSVFFGGGTPSLWHAAALGRVLDGIAARFQRVVDDLEVTVECNPTSIDRGRAAALRDVGVNRLSLGVQSLERSELKFLGRLHDDDGALRALDAAVAVMPRVSADLMFGMPGQRAEAFLAQVEGVLSRGVEHISAYALTVEPDTQFGALHRQGKLKLAAEDDYAETFSTTSAQLSERGFEHYEVSNYARAGAASRHNQHYWRGGDYVGLGAGAVGTLSCGNSARRTRNDPLPERYMADPQHAVVEVDALDPDARVREGFMLGLRTSEGVDLAAMRACTGLDPKLGREASMTRRLARGDVVLEGERLRVPRERWLMMDSIVADLF